MTVDFGNDAFEIIENLKREIEGIEEYTEMCVQSDSWEKMKSDLKKLCDLADLDYSKMKNPFHGENPFYNRNWEHHNIGRPNLFTQLSLYLMQLKIMLAEEILKFNPNDRELILKLKKFRDDFEKDYDHSYYVD